LAVLALALERGLLRFLYGKEHLMQLLFMFAIVLLVGDLVKMIWGADNYSVDYPPGLGGAIKVGTMVFPAYLVFLSALGPVIAGGDVARNRPHALGSHHPAATQDREMLSALGINVPLVYSGVFVIGSALAGFGGALAAPRVAVSLGMDATVIVECFIIVIIGGLASCGAASWARWRSASSSSSAPCWCPTGRTCCPI